MASGAIAATITVQPEGPEGTAMVRVDGVLERGDEWRFAAALVDLQATHDGPVDVVLHSEGGDVDAALGIGRAIRANQYRTVVRAASNCESACAFAWLAGVPFVLGPGAAVGFHESRPVDGRQSAGIGNAHIALYLNELGFDINVVDLALGTPWHKVTYLNPDLAQRHGLPFWEARSLTPRIDGPDTPQFHLSRAALVDPEGQNHEGSGGWMAATQRSAEGKKDSAAVATLRFPTLPIALNVSLRDHGRGNGIFVTAAAVGREEGGLTPDITAARIKRDGELTALRQVGTEYMANRYFIPPSNSGAALDGLAWLELTLEVSAGREAVAILQMDEDLRPFLSTAFQTPPSTRTPVPLPRPKHQPNASAAQSSPGEQKAL